MIEPEQVGDERQRISLADASAPINPEQAAAMLGQALAQRHQTPVVADDAVSLTELAGQLQAAAAADPQRTIDSGPYLDRRVEDLAAIAVETAASIGGDVDAAGVSPGLTLDVVELDRDGVLHIVGPSMASDRHLDLAGASVGLAVRFGPAIVAPFLTSYGMDAVDLRRLDLCQLLLTIAEAVDFDFLSASS